MTPPSTLKNYIPKCFRLVQWMEKTYKEAEGEEYCPLVDEPKFMRFMRVIDPKVTLILNKAWNICLITWNV